MSKKEHYSSKKITKLTLVIYFCLMFAAFATTLTISLVQKNNTYIFAYLLCLLPSLFYVIIGLTFTAQMLIKTKSKKVAIAAVVILHSLRYILLFTPIFICIFFQQYFNVWVVLAITVFSPAYIIILKIIIANIVSKNNKSEEKNNKNTIQF